jgi:hypothetical protein
LLSVILIYISIDFYNSRITGNIFIILNAI